MHLQAASYFNAVVPFELSRHAVTELLKRPGRIDYQHLLRNRPQTDVRQPRTPHRQLRGGTSYTLHGCTFTRMRQFVIEKASLARLARVERGECDG
jgi:hypothetical protein